MEESFYELSSFTKIFASFLVIFMLSLHMLTRTCPKSLLFPWAPSIILLRIFLFYIIWLLTSVKGYLAAKSLSDTIMVRICIN